MTLALRSAKIAELAEWVARGFWHAQGTNPRRFFPDHPSSPQTDAHMAITFYISDLVPDRIREAVYRAIDEWSKATGIEFVEQYHIGAQISVWMNSDWEDRAFTIWDINDREGEFDEIWSSSLVFNNSYVFLSDQALFEQAMEEWGHALGLGHSFLGTGHSAVRIFEEYDKHSYTVMSYTDDAEIAGLQEVDYAAAALLYGPQTINTGNDVYAITSDLHPHIEDHGGIDWLDWYASIDYRVLDVRPGGATEQASFGETTYIEHVEVMNREVNPVVIYEDEVVAYFEEGEISLTHGQWAFATWGFGA